MLALQDLREYKPQSHEFEESAGFLTSDPYGLLPDDAIKQIRRDIAIRRLEYVYGKEIEVES